MLVSYCLTHSDFGTNQFLDHDGGKTNKEKWLKSYPLMLENKEEQRERIKPSRHFLKSYHILKVLHLTLIRNLIPKGGTS